MSADDTFERSLAHWSEARRDEMDAFYTVASLDYRELARAWDWNRELRRHLPQGGTLRILDVACGSGKFPEALREHTQLGGLRGTPLVLDLLDPSAFSIREASASLRPPMRAGESFECTLQALPAEARDYDVVWAVHALYALPEAELAEGVAAFLRALAPNGLGFVGHATRASHYLAFYEAYRAGREGTTPYTSAEAIAAAFAAAGATVEVRPLRYTQVIHNEEVLEGFLQRCLFDDDLSLAAMHADPALGPYLAERRGDDGAWRFAQEVSMIFVRHAD
ncbi:MAG: class I SAM-dependent methyltransferase [Myxococcota bacterium]